MTVGLQEGNSAPARQRAPRGSSTGRHTRVEGDGPTTSSGFSSKTKRDRRPGPKGGDFRVGNDGPERSILRVRNRRPVAVSIHRIARPFSQGGAKRRDRPVCAVRPDSQKASTVRGIGTQPAIPAVYGVKADWSHVSLSATTHFTGAFAFSSSTQCSMRLTYVIGRGPGGTCITKNR